MRDARRRGRKRKLGEDGYDGVDEEDVVGSDGYLKLQSVHVDGLGTEQVWGQARRVLEAVCGEVERGVKESVGFKKWYIRFAETVNGRLAAAGFMLCLMREMWEPGHPSLVEQVQQVVTPLAAHTPGFIVAVYAGVVDMFT